MESRYTEEMLSGMEKEQSSGCFLHSRSSWKI